MRSLLATLALPVAVGAPSGPVAAQLVVPVAQSRFVSGDADVTGPGTVLGDSDDDQAADFRPYVASVTAAVDGLFEATAAGGGNQSSSILADSIVASGQAFADTNALVEGWLAIATGESKVIVDFTLTAKAAWSLVGQVSSYGGSSSYVYLSGPGGTFFVEGASDPFEIVPVDANGVLAPGEYTIRVLCVAGTVSDMKIGSYSGLGEYDLTLAFTPLSGNTCVAAPNSAGPGATLSFGGSQSLAADDFHLQSTGGRPGGSGLFFYGPNAIQVPFGDGFRCVGGQLHRLQPPIQNDATGFGTKQVSFTSGPAASGSGAILADSTWNFQLWYRDPMGPGGSGFNLSDGLWVTFCE